METEKGTKKLGEVAILILAAGASSRMGQSKQLLPVNGEPLLKRITRAASSVKEGNVFVVLGSEEMAHRKVIGDIPVETIVAPNWMEGIGGTLKTGLRHIIHSRPSIEALIVLVCDQPYVSGEYLEKLIDAYRSTNSTIVVSRYANTVGVPVLFSNAHFDELLKLENKQRGKEVIEKNSKFVTQIDFPEGAIDLDTREDYDQFIKKNNYNNFG
jgi:molybdenum cofactor cytidylyltransferase